MERELHHALYHWIYRLAQRVGRPKRVQHSDALVVMTFFWAVLHDRPICWACDRRHWPTTCGRSWRLPSNATMSRRLRSESVRSFIDQLHESLRGDLSIAGLYKVIDSKPLFVGSPSRDRQATAGRRRPAGVPDA